MRAIFLHQQIPFQWRIKSLHFYHFMNFNHEKCGKYFSLEWFLCFLIFIFQFHRSLSFFQRSNKYFSSTGMFWFINFQSTRPHRRAMLYRSSVEANWAPKLAFFFAVLLALLFSLLLPAATKLELVGLNVNGETNMRRKMFMFLVFKALTFAVCFGIESSIEWIRAFLNRFFCHHYSSLESWIFHNVCLLIVRCLTCPNEVKFNFEFWAIENSRVRH